MDRIKELEEIIKQKDLRIKELENSLKEIKDKFELYTNGLIVDNEIKYKL